MPSCLGLEMVGPMPEVLLLIGPGQLLLDTIHSSFQSKTVIRDKSETEKLFSPIPTKQMLEFSFGSTFGLHFTSFCENKISKSNIRNSTKNRKKISDCKCVQYLLQRL